MKRGQGMSSRIDPEHVPRPVGQVDAIKEEGGKVYETTRYNSPPLSTTVCRVMDRGSVSCHFMRSTVNQVPAYPATANTAHVPLAVVCQPFAELNPLEEAVPLVDMGDAGPMRCLRCRAYVNAFFQWASHGREVACNLCGHRMEVPGEYFSPLDQNGRRRDHGERPELVRGTVDYIAPKDYSDSVPAPPSVVFVVEASMRSVQSGLFLQVILSIKKLLEFLTPPASRVGLITFDSSLQFYAFHRGSCEAQQITVGDIEDPFQPCGIDVLLVDAHQDDYRSKLEGLLNKLPDLCKDTCVEQAAAFAAMKAATDMLGSAGGGNVLMFHVMRPTVGIGALKVRNDMHLPGTSEEEAANLAPQQAPFLDSIVRHCLEKGVAVSSFCAPSAGYIDAASLSVVPRKTGGEFFFMPGFDWGRDGEKLHFDITRTVMQGCVYSCVFKLRCSKGLAVESMIAPWDAEVIDPSTFQVARLSVDGVCTFTLQHLERLEGSKHIYLQAACLHTDKNGRRLIRVQTFQLPVTSSLSHVFRFCEVDVVTNLLMKQATTSILTGLPGFKDKLTRACVDMLHAYRINCASTTSPGQLILPESLKMLPLYVSCMRKMVAFRSGTDVRVDEKVAGLVQILGLPMWTTAPMVYPRVFLVWPTPDRAGRSTGIGDNVHMPNNIACSFDKLISDRLYLIDSGVALHLYICRDVQPETLEDLFGVSTPLQVADLLRQRDQASISDEGQKILAIVQQIRRDRAYPRFEFMPLIVAAAATPEEARILALLREDKMAGEQCYVDFLCHVHKCVQNKMDPS